MELTTSGHKQKRRGDEGQGAQTSIFLMILGGAIGETLAAARNLLSREMLLNSNRHGYLLSVVRLWRGDWNI